MGRRGAVRVTDRDYDEVISAVYDAALGSLQWATVLPRITRFLGAERGGLGARTRGSEAAFLLFHNLDTEILARWGGEFSGYDPWVERFGERKRPGELLHGGSEPFLAEMREKEIYAAIYSPLGVDDLLAIPVARHGTWLGYVGVYRSRSEGLFDEDDLERAQLLAPHLVRAAAIHERIGALGEEAAAAEAVLECMAYGVLLLDETGGLVWSNRQGERLLREESILALRSGVVRALEPRVDVQLAASRSAAAQVAAGKAARASPKISIAQSAKGRRLEILTVPVGVRSSDSALSFTARRARVALVIADPTAAANLPVAAVGKVLDLPPALARLAAAISSGQTVAEYAEQAGLSAGTVRQQLKDLFAREGLHRQADLVRVLQRSIAALAPVFDWPA